MDELGVLYIFLSPVEWFAIVAWMSIYVMCMQAYKFRYMFVSLYSSRCVGVKLYECMRVSVSGLV